MKFEKKTEGRDRWVFYGAVLALLTSFLVLGIKTYAYHLTGSVVVLSDALESIVNVITAILALLVLRYVSEPADEEHPYGHGKMEYFSAAFEGGLIAFAALLIGFEAVMALLEQKEPSLMGEGAALIGLATALNWIAGFAILRIAKSHRSEALKASGNHLMSDVVTSVGAVIGLGLVHLTGLVWLDPALAIIIALQLGYTGYGIVRNSLGALIDEVDVKVIEEFAKSLRVAGISDAIDVHHVRFIRSGFFHHVDAHVVLPEFWTVEKSHAVTLEMERQVREAYPYDLEIAFHVDPCERNYCSNCSLKDCLIRKEAFVAPKVWSAANLIQGPPEEM